MHKHGGDIYREEYELDFSANINPYGMPEGVRKAAEKGIAASQYYPDVQQECLKNKIAETEGIQSSWICCGNGAAELIYAAVYAVRPQKVLLAVPSFAEYEQALANTDCEIIYYYLRESEAFMIKEDILKYLDEDIDMFFLCTPNNPTGQLIEAGLYQSIADRCKENRIHLVADECFLDFLEQKDKYSLKSQLQNNRYILILKAFTKIYAMPGLRLGYSMCSDTCYIKKLQACMQPWNVSVPAQMAGRAALDEIEFVQKSIKDIQNEREYLKRELQMLGLDVLSGTANFLFIKSQYDLWSFFHERKVLVRDCSNYTGLNKGYYRIAVKTRKDNKRLLEIIQKDSSQLEKYRL